MDATEKGKAEANDQRLLRIARRKELVAHKSRKNGRWYFSDFRNMLRSPERGLQFYEALDFLVPAIYDATKS